MNDPILSNPHFADFIDVPHLFNDQDRLPGPNGEPGVGLNLREAVFFAEYWWEKAARFSMPDFGKPDEKQVIKSGVLMGLPWQNLARDEKLRVLAQWYAHVGVHTIIEAKSTSQDGDVVPMQKAKEKSGKVFDALEKAAKATHRPTSDDLEMKVWEKGYEEIEADGKILSANGQPTKGEGNGKETGESREETGESRCKEQGV